MASDLAAYCEGLLDAQRMANEHAARAHAEGKTEVVEALSALSTALAVLRKDVS